MSKIYVSSTMLDLGAERQAVMNWLIAAGHQPKHSYTADSETVRDSCLEDVFECDIVVLILGHRYGHQPEDGNPDGLSITHLEFRRARSAGIPVIALFRTAIPDVRLSDIQDPQRMGALEDFHREVRRAVRPAEFEDAAGLIHHLSNGVNEELNKQCRRAWLSAPDLRERFRRASWDLLSWTTTLPQECWLARTELDVLQKQIADTPHSVHLLLGEPGCGKSALLARLGGLLEQQSIPVLGIKADYLPEQLDDGAALGSHLGLPDTPAVCVKALAKDGPVVVLLDQLDALADLLVQHSDRLRVPLGLIRDLSGIENVHVVASCRPFEHRHDPRLRNLDAETVELALPAWEEVDAALREHGVFAAAWSKEVRDVLLSPQALDIFLRRLRSTDETHLLNGYHGVLQALWDQSVACDPSGQRRELLFEMTRQMADQETLWLTATRFESQRQAVNALIAAGVLAPNPDETRIGFRHQTLYEFVRARSFLEVQGSLSDAVLVRQDSLRIRSQLWHALGYLRNTHWPSYTAELGRLWNSPTLRGHLRMLLIEFLGQIHEPRPEEQRLFAQRFDDPWYRTRILSAVMGNSAWFGFFARGRLSELMVQSRERAAAVFPLLASAMRFAPDTVLRLLDACWLPRPEMDYQSWQVIQETQRWDGTLVDRLCGILGRRRLDGWRVNHAASLVSAVLPDAAPRLLGKWLEYEWNQDENEAVVSAAAPNTADPESSDGAAAIRAQALLESQELHDVEAVATAAPLAFLNAVWPTFVEILAATAQDSHPVLIRFRDHGALIDALGNDDDELAHRERPLLNAVAAAVTGLARQQPAAFLEYARENEGRDLLLVQRILAMGMTEIVNTHSDAALSFLCADSRRLLLGPFGDEHGNTRNLIQALAPHLRPDALTRLEICLTEWKRYHNPPDEEASVRLQRLRWSREHRLDLLQALPRNGLSPSGRRLLVEEERAFPRNGKRERRSFRMRAIGSPMSTEQMRAARDEDIVRLFEELTDTSGWDHPRHRMQGGAIQAGRALGELAKSDPKRAVHLARHLAPSQNEIPVSQIIDSLAEANFDPQELYALIQEFAGKGFISPSFQHSAAHAIEATVTPEHHLPESLFSLLEHWLCASPAPDADSEFLKDVENEPDRSLLWDMHGARIVPHGNLSLLAALSAACLTNRPPQTDRWLDILEAHMERPESPKVWASLAVPYLTELHRADRDRAQRFLDRLFQTQPVLRSTLEGILLLGHCQRWVDESHMRRWLNDMAGMPEPAAAQGCGELLMFRRALFPHENWLADRVADFLRADDGNTTRSLVRIGIAHTVARLWADPLRRRLAHGYLLDLVRTDERTVHRALARVFHDGYLPTDTCTNELLDAICAHPEILHAPSAEFLPEALEDLVAVEPERVHRVCETLLDQVGENMSNHATAWPMRSDILVTIALALQDLRGEYRTGGTALFERLLEFNLPYAQTLLTDLDRRTANCESAAAPRPRRRRRRRSVRSG